MTETEEAKEVDNVEVDDIELPPEKDKSDWSRDRRDSIKESMSQKKEEARLPLAEDIYALIAVCPVFSRPFFVAVLVVLLKIVVYAILATDIRIGDRIQADRILTTLVKFFLVPVSVAMQEDLMGSFYFYANGLYCDSMLNVSKSATKGKLLFSYFARTIDGIFSLYVNFTVMLTTEKTLGVFLNFAALQFLQSIDDVFYELIDKGFLGDSMEHWAEKCKDITIKRRHGPAANHKLFFVRVSHLDTYLFMLTAGMCYIAWIVLTVAEYNEAVGERFYGPKVM